MSKKQSLAKAKAKAKKKTVDRKKKAGKKSR